MPKFLPKICENWLFFAKILAIFGFFWNFCKKTQKFEFLPKIGYFSKKKHFFEILAKNGQKIAKIGYFSLKFCQFFLLIFKIFAKNTQKFWNFAQNILFFEKNPIFWNFGQKWPKFCIFAKNWWKLAIFCQNFAYFRPVFQIFCQNFGFFHHFYPQKFFFKFVLKMAIFFCIFAENCQKIAQFAIFCFFLVFLVKNFEILTKNSQKFWKFGKNLTNILRK